MFPAAFAGSVLATSRGISKSGAALNPRVPPAIWNSSASAPPTIENVRLSPSASPASVSRSGPQKLFSAIEIAVPVNAGGVSTGTSFTSTTSPKFQPGSAAANVNSCATPSPARSNDRPPISRR